MARVKSQLVLTLVTHCVPNMLNLSCCKTFRHQMLRESLDCQNQYLEPEKRMLETILFAKGRIVNSLLQLIGVIFPSNDGWDRDQHLPDICPHQWAVRRVLSASAFGTAQGHRVAARKKNGLATGDVSALVTQATMASRNRDSFQ